MIGDISGSQPGTAARYNTGKPDYSMIPLLAMEDCAKVFMYGAQKYSKNNWMKGQDWSVPFACMMRHLSAWQRGEDIDPESGLPHLGHVMCNLVMLTTYSRTWPAGDDRPVEWLQADPKTATWAELMARQNTDEGVLPKTLEDVAA